MMLNRNIVLLFIALAVHANAQEVSATKLQSSQKSIVSHYTKLAAKGKKVTHNPRAAGCVLDNQNGLVWELKTDDDGVHDKDNTYRWGGRGAEQIGTLFFDDWNLLLDVTNKEKLCGFSDWRMPTIDELKTLVVAGSIPAIDRIFFHLTLPKPYWSASAYKNYPVHGQTVHFETGASYYYNGFRGDRLPLRLVRGYAN